MTRVGMWLLGLWLLALGCSDASTGPNRVVDLATPVPAEPAVEPPAPAPGDAVPAADTADSDEADGDSAADADEGGAAADSGAIQIKGQGTVDESALRELLERSTPAAQRCLKGHDSAVAVSIKVKPNGKVGYAKLRSPGVPARVEKCLVKQIKRFKFPRPSGGAVYVTWPIAP